MARRDWKADDTSWDPAHNAQRRTGAAIQERNAKAVTRGLILVAKRGASQMFTGMSAELLGAHRTLIA